MISWIDAHFMEIYIFLLCLAIIMIFISEGDFFWEMMGYKTKRKERDRSMWEQPHTRMARKNYVNRR